MYTVQLGADGEEVRALFDSGSTDSFMCRKYVQSMNLAVHKGKHFVSSFSGNMSVLNEFVKVYTKFDNNVAYLKYWILDQSPFDIILGTEALKALRVTLNFSCAIDKKAIINPNLNKKQTLQLNNLLESFNDIFSENEYDIGHCTVLKHNIDVGQEKPFKSKQYPFPHAIRDEIKTKINELLRQGIVQPSKSPWSNPIFFIRKKCGGLRLVVDFRKLNEITKTDNFPIPIIDDMLANMSGCKYFTSLDLTSGYYQVEMDSESKEKTAFIVDNKLLEFNRLPFGLKNAPGLFQRIMQQVLVDTGVLPYLDDIVIASSEFDKHLASIRNVLSRFRQYNLKIKPSKCVFAANQILFLGHLISEDGIKPDPKKIDDLLKMAPPKSVKEVERFCGFVNYLGKFIPNLSDIFEPVFLSKKSKPFFWSTECHNAFIKLKANFV